MNRRSIAAVTLLSSVICSGTGFGWWDTQIQVVKPPPTVRDVQAEACPGLAENALADDRLAWGGKCALLQPGGTTLTFEHACVITHYCVYVVCRADGLQEDKETYAKPVILTLRVTNKKTGKRRQWRQRIAYLAQRYEDGGHLYFPVYEPGNYTIEVGLHERSACTLRVDYLALKDLFHSFPAQKKGQYGAKRRQNLHTKAELEALRDQPASLKLANQLLEGQIKRGLVPGSEGVKQWRKSLFLDLWDAKPPRNLHFAIGKLAKQRGDGEMKVPLTWQLRRGWGPWTFENPTTKATYGFEQFNAGETMGNCVFPDDLAGYAPNADAASDKTRNSACNWAGCALMRRCQAIGNLAVRRAGEYLKTGNQLAGWEGLCALITFADIYPDIDYASQEFLFGKKGFGMNPYGKFRYSGHAWGRAKQLLEAYDALFPAIAASRDLPALMRQRVPWIRNAQDVVRMLDRDLCQHIRDCVDRQVIRAGEGDSEMVCVLGALVQGPGAAGDWILELPFTRCHVRMVNRGGLQDHFISSTATDGCAYIGSVEYAKARPKIASECISYIARYKTLGGKPRFDLSDPVAFPNVAQGPFFNLNRMVAGGFTPRVGDWGTAADPPHIVELQGPRYRSLYTHGFQSTGDPRFAFWLRRWGRATEDDAFWSKVLAAAANCETFPYLRSRTRGMPGFGIGVLEAGVNHDERWKKSAVVLRVGVGQGHGHCDQLSILHYANGVRAVVNNGRRGGKNNSRGTRWHNTMEIDEKDWMPKKMGSTGVGWLETVKDLGGDLGYMRGLSRSPSHPHVKLFRRDVALIPVGDEDAVVFDVFSVTRGKVHTWICAGPTSPRDGVSFSVPVQPSKLPDDLRAARADAAKAGKTFEPEKQPGYALVDRYLGGWDGRKQGECADVTTITWQVKPDVLPRYYGRGDWPEGKKDTTVQVRAWRLGARGQPLLAAFGGFSDYAVKSAPTRNFVYTRNEGDAELSRAYPTVTECYRDGKPLVRKVEPLITDASGALAPVAVKLIAANGEETILYSDGSGTAKGGAAGIRTQGEFASVTRSGAEVLRAALVGGTSLECNGFSIHPERARYRATVTALDVEQNGVTVDTALPAGLLDGENFLVRRSGVDHNANYIVTSVEPGEDTSVLRLRGGIKVYQSAVTHVLEDRGEIALDLPLVLNETDDTYYEGMALLNEKGDILGPAEVRSSERFMFMWKPWHQKWRQTFKSLEGVPDADGDGQRTLKMLATSRQRQMLPEEKPIEAGDLMKILVVTRVSESGDMIWFREKRPEVVFGDSIPVPHRHWPYQNQKLVTEDGTRELQANYPGDTLNLAVKGRKLKSSDIPDADGDGRTCVALSAFTPGDVLETPTYASLVKEGAGLYRLRANCAVTLGIPSKEVLIGVKQGGRMKVSRPSLQRGAFTVTEDQLRQGELYVILPGADGYELKF